MTNKGARFSQLVTRAKRLSPIHPGELLLKEFMIPMGLSANRLAKAEIGKALKMIKPWGNRVED